LSTETLYIDRDKQRILEKEKAKTGKDKKVILYEALERGLRFFREPLCIRQLDQDCIEKLAKDWNKKPLEVLDEVVEAGLVAVRKAHLA
jgi:hypothetical protein